jgi:hypothetical protein
MTKVATKAYQNIRLKLRRKLLSSLQPCRDVTAVMSESLERQLSLAERIKMRLHMMVCTWCKRYLEQITLMKTLFNGAPTPTQTEHLSNEARNRILDRLKKNRPSW